LRGIYQPFFFYTEKPKLQFCRDTSFRASMFDICGRLG